MSLSFTVLGCGSSGGVPRIDGNWGKCNPAEPRNRRRRCAGLVERSERAGTTRLLIDTPPDVRESMLAVGADAVDAVFYTHDHADHTHGIDDLRIFALNAGARLPVYFDATTGAGIVTRFDYCFRPSVSGSYPAILKPHQIEPMQPVTLGGKGGLITLTPFPQQHGDIISMGYRIAGLAYSPDISGVPPASLPMLRDLDVWILDALRPMPHPSHFSLPQALEWIERLKPKRAILTHLHVDLDYQSLRRALPANVVPAYDGMVIDLDGDAAGAA